VFLILNYKQIYDFWRSNIDVHQKYNIVSKWSLAYKNFCK
jgi:hypothetical protein